MFMYVLIYDKKKMSFATNSLKCIVCTKQMKRLKKKSKHVHACYIIYVRVRYEYEYDNGFSKKKNKTEVH